MDTHVRTYAVYLGMLDILADAIVGALSRFTDKTILICMLSLCGQPAERQPAN